MKRGPFFDQAALLLRTLPHVMKESSFALKGGTAINLFLRDMPRLSVDIDLTWLPIEPRDEALAGIGSALGQAASEIRRGVPGSQVSELRSGGGNLVSKILVRLGEAQIKVEPNLVIRGAVFPTEERDLCPRAQSEFELFVSARTLSIAELYGGKICAALDRQHPRDLFDIKILLENEGLTDDIRRAFVVHLASHDRPMHELLDPNRKEISDAFRGEFAEMTEERVILEELLEVREDLIARLLFSLTENERRFLLSVKDGEPEWNLMDLPNLEDLPAIRWKVINIRRMKKAKREEEYAMLAAMLRM